MRLIPRQRHQRRSKALPRIAISEAEIAADLHYPAGRREPSAASGVRARSGAR